MSIDELRGHGRSSEPAATHVKHADRLTLTLLSADPSPHDFADDCHCMFPVAARRIEWCGKHRFVGDIGDYLKLGILRNLSPGCRLGWRGGYSQTKPTTRTAGMSAL